MPAGPEVPWTQPESVAGPSPLVLEGRLESLLAAGTQLPIPHQDASVIRALLAVAAG